jgi:hypothetical protein
VQQVEQVFQCQKAQVLVQRELEQPKCQLAVYRQTGLALKLEEARVVAEQKLEVLDMAIHQR